MTDEYVTEVQWPKTPEEREDIADYGDLVSNIIWYPVYNDAAEVVCQNCGEEMDEHELPSTGLCPDKIPHDSPGHNQSDCKTCEANWEYWHGG